MCCKQCKIKNSFDPFWDRMVTVCVELRRMDLANGTNTVKQYLDYQFGEVSKTRNAIIVSLNIELQRLGEPMYEEK